MGSRGWYCFLYKGVYYRFYNNRESSFTGLGAFLVKELIRGGQELLHATKTVLELGEVQGGSIGPPEDPIRKKEWEQALATARAGEFPEEFPRGGLEDHTDTFLVGDGCFIEYIYVIDLDRMQFSAKGEFKRPPRIYTFPIDDTSTLDPNVMDLISKEPPEIPENVIVSQAFPIPKCVLDKFHTDMQKKGYKATSNDPISLGLNAYIFPAIELATSREVL